MEKQTSRDAPGVAANRGVKTGGKAAGSGGGQTPSPTAETTPSEEAPPPALESTADQGPSSSQPPAAGTAGGNTQITITHTDDGGFNATATNSAGEEVTEHFTDADGDGVWESAEGDTIDARNEGGQRPPEGTQPVAEDNKGGGTFNNSSSTETSESDTSTESDESDDSSADSETGSEDDEEDEDESGGSEDDDGASTSDGGESDEGDSQSGTSGTPVDPSSDRWGGSGLTLQQILAHEAIKRQSVSKPSGEDRSDVNLQQILAHEAIKRQSVSKPSGEDRSDVNLQQILAHEAIKRQSVSTPSGEGPSDTGSGAQSTRANNISTSGPQTMAPGPPADWYCRRRLLNFYTGGYAMCFCPVPRHPLTGAPIIRFLPAPTSSSSASGTPADQGPYQADDPSIPDPSIPPSPNTGPPGYGSSSPSVAGGSTTGFGSSLAPDTCMEYTDTEYHAMYPDDY